MSVPFGILAADTGSGGGFILLLFCCLVVLYFLPTISAYRGKHPSREGIALLNFLAGWTFVGWVVAMVWSVTKPAKVTVPVHTAVYVPDVSSIAQPALSAQGMKDCPACFSAVPDAASVCRVCLHKFTAAD